LTKETIKEAANASAETQSEAATTPAFPYVARFTMMSPRPPPPAIAAIVAVAITKMAEIRTPARISGSASGSSTRRSTCASVMPMPRAASTTSRSTPSTAK